MADAREERDNEAPVADVVTNSADLADALAELGEEDDCVYGTLTVKTPSTTQRERVKNTVAPSPQKSRRPLLSSGAAVILGLIGVAACTVIALSVYTWGKPAATGLPAGHPDISTMSAQGKDTQSERSPSEIAEQVVQLRAEVQAHPQDVSKRLTLGVALFEARDLAGAKEQWDAAIDLDPRNEEAYFNLGFWYLSQQPADTAKSEEMWDKVLELAPKSEHARIIMMHRTQLDSATDHPTSPNQQ